MTQYLLDNVRGQHAHVLAPASGDACLLLTERC